MTSDLDEPKENTRQQAAARIQSIDPPKTVTGRFARETSSKDSEIAVDRRVSVTTDMAPFQPVRISAALRRRLHCCVRGGGVCSPPNRAGLSLVLQQNASCLSVRARGAVSAAGAVVVGAKVDGFAAKGAAVVDEFLVLLDGHVVLCIVCDEE